MSTTSKKYFDEKFKKEIWGKFLKAVNQAKSIQELHSILEKVLTPNQVIMLEKRLGTLHMLDMGFNYRDIGETIDIMPKTIAFIKNGYKKPVETKKRKSKDVSRSAEMSFAHKKNSIMPTYAGKGRWNRR